MAIRIRVIADYDSPAAGTDTGYRPLVLLGDLSARHLARPADSFGQYALAEKNGPTFWAQSFHAYKRTQTAAIQCVDSFYSTFCLSRHGRMGTLLRALQSVWQSYQRHYQLALYMGGLYRGSRADVHHPYDGAAPRPTLVQYHLSGRHAIEHLQPPTNHGARY